MLASDIRVLLAVCYLVLLAWRVVAERRLPDYWWVVLLTYYLSILSTHLIEFILHRWNLRRIVASYRSLGPEERQAALGRIWMAGTRRALRDLVAAEGEADTGGMVESYPFARRAKVSALVLFWSAIGLTLVSYSLLIFVRGLPLFVASLLWVFGTSTTLAAGTLRYRIQYMESLLENTRFGITEVETDGTRKTIPWSGPLLLRYRRWPKRLELTSPGRPERIRLDFERLAIDRAVGLTLEYGGFKELAAEKGAE